MKIYTPKLISERADRFLRFHYLFVLSAFHNHFNLEMIGMFSFLRRNTQTYQEKNKNFSPLSSATIVLSRCDSLSI